MGRIHLAICFLLLWPAVALAGMTLTTGGQVLPAIDGASADGGAWQVWRSDEGSRAARGTVGAFRADYWAGETGVYLQGLAVGTELVAMVERDVTPGQPERKGYYATAVHILNGTDPALFPGMVLKEMPVPSVTLSPGYIAHLAWSATDDGNVTGYHVYRSNDGATFVRITAEPIAGSTFTDTGFPPETSYYTLGLVYRGSPAVEGGVLSANSNLMRDGNGNGIPDAEEPNMPPFFTNEPVTAATQDQPYSFTPAASDPDGDSLVFSIVNQPAWADFDPQTGTLSGIPGNDDVGTTSNIVIGVSDGEYTVFLPPFDLTVENVNDPPILAQPITDQNVNQEQPFSFTVPEETFIDIDVDDVLTLSAEGVGGELPGWLSFDPQTETFSGTPGRTDIGSFEIRVTATDLAGASVSVIFLLTVIDNIAPQLPASTMPWLILLLED